VFPTSYFYFCCIIFEQLPNNHILKSHRCPSCTGNRKTTTNSFIIDAKKIHKNKYDYSLVEYKNNATKVKIRCRKHGVFEQAPSSHLSGRGCYQCSLETRKESKYTTKEIVDQFIAIHGYLYDYSRVEYVKSNIKVIIICPLHGEFEQTPNNHKMGKGCNVCAGRVISEKEVLSQFKKVHGDTYDYSLFKYHGTDSKSKIICREHGEFEQTPYAHKNQQGCPKCIGRNTTQDELLVLFEKIHGDKYDYSKVDYVNKDSSIKIICREHGEFNQLPMKHARGSGCPKCYGHGFTNTEIIEKFKKIHEDKYDYELVSFKTNKDKIIIKCPQHGEFKQIVQVHLSGAGCPDCGGSRQWTTYEIIEQFKITHGDKYDYSLVEYKGADNKVKIICPEHGIFEQSARGHKKGNECTACVDYGFDYFSPAILYYLKIDKGMAYKIGVTNNTIERRYIKKELNKIQVLKIWNYKTGKEAFNEEQRLLKKYISFRYTGSPLLERGNTELFNCDVLGLDKKSKITC